MSSPEQSHVVLGIESGGTRTVALAANDNGVELLRREFGPANLRLLDDRKLRQHFASIARGMPRPSTLAIGMAGARTEQDRARIRTAAAATWKGVPCLATNDLETALKAAPPAEFVAANVLILSGTGSCCFGQSSDGKSVKVGGWGHILGDKGSGYEIGLRGLKASIYHFDRDGQWPALGERLLRALMLNEPNDLITWVQTATKTDIAALAVEVFDAWTARDKIASDILEAAANSLARDGLACATRLVGAQARVQFVLAGSVLTRQPQFAALVRRLLEEQRAGSLVTVLERESVWGAVELAKTQVGRAVPRAPGSHALTPDPFAFTSVASLKKSPTEMRNPRSMKLDRMSPRDSIKLMLSEDARLPSALLKELPSIEKAVEIVSRSLRGGGRLFYVGAGTSASSTPANVRRHSRRRPSWCRASSPVANAPCGRPSKAPKTTRKPARARSPRAVSVPATSSSESPRAVAPRSCGAHSLKRSAAGRAPSCSPSIPFSPCPRACVPP